MGKLNIKDTLQHAYLKNTLQLDLPPPSFHERLNVLRHSLTDVDLLHTRSPQLVITDKSGRRVVQVDKEKMTLGAVESSDILISEEYVSRRHCSIQVDADQWFVVDNDSTNGVYLNGQKVSNALLKDGDILLVGKSKVIFIEGWDEEIDELLP